MKSLGFACYALSSCVVAALLSGCGGNAGNAMPQAPASRIGDALSNHHTFRYIGAQQSFEVPAGVTRISVVALGAAGGGLQGGLGGRVFAEIPVTPGETLYVDVGGPGKKRDGGFNGGGRGGGDFHTLAAYGGGASDVCEGGDVLMNRILAVGGGGGGQGGFDGDRFGFGGKGGGSVAGPGMAL